MPCQGLFTAIENEVQKELKISWRLHQHKTFWNPYAPKTTMNSKKAAKTTILVKMFKMNLNDNFSFIL